LISGIIFEFDSIMHRILNSYLRRLTNLTSRNKSLLLLRLISGRYLDVNEFDFLNNKPAFSIVEQLIARKKEIFLCRVLDSRDETNNKVSQKLRKIWRSDRFVFEERGAKDLCLAWPFARGYLADGTPVRAPLLFFPVSVKMEENGWILRPRTQEYCYLNRSLLLAYAHFNKLPVDEKLMDFNFEEFPSDSRAFRVALYDLFKNSGIELNFNQDNFTDNLFPFRGYTKTEFEAEFKQGTITLQPEAVLGLFPQAGSYLVPDYLKLMNDQSIQDIGELFNSQKISLPESEYGFISSIKEEQTITPFKIDAFQENALKAIKSGKSLVVQGPPGTGKSQLIANVLADYAARGKRVLMVCQKRAALDVVAERLQHVGMGKFLALVHDFKNDRRSLYAQILDQIDSLDDYRRKNNSLDAIKLEREFLQASRQIDHLTEELEEFKQALFDSTECGLSVKELYLSSSLDLPHTSFKQEFKHFDLEQTEKFKRSLKSYHKYRERLNKEGFPWKERRSFHNYTIKDLTLIEKVIDEVVEYSNDIVNQTTSLLNTEVTFDMLDELRSRKDQVDKFLALVKDPMVYKYLIHQLNYKEVQNGQLGFANIERIVLECFKKEGPEVSIPDDELGYFQEVIQQRISSRKNIFKWLGWHLFSKEKMQYQRVLRANGLTNNREGFKLLTEKIDNRLNLEHNLQKLKGYPWLTEIPVTLNQVDFQAWTYYQKRALEAHQLFTSQRNFVEYFNLEQLSYDQLKKAIEKLLAIIDEIPQRKARWLTYLMPLQLSQILNDPKAKGRFRKSLGREFENLCEFDRLQHNLVAAERSVIAKVYELIEEEQDLNPVDLFENSLRLSWIEHIEAKYPILRIVSSLKLEETEQEFQENVDQKFQTCREILLLKLRENLYKDVKYNRLNNMISYRDLKHQVSKKRRIWPIRKLLSQFHEELFALIPCWLASPESISAITPMTELFDLVIFDEASQCFAEKGIPAIYRAKQVVVTGDSQQLTPNDLYQIRWQEEEATEIELEIDSLLDLASTHLHQVHLQGHYRSKSLDLMAFSNQHFYQGKLRMLPEFQVLNRKEPAIDYIKIDGQWERNLNQNEAMEVVMLVEKITKDAPEKSIGVVTFNIQQQQYITECLEDRFIQTEQPIPESLIVKNIENVQGDEKDIIIFSVGYAPDNDGKMSMKFGSLNTAGGENRLNVAITRAREHIYVITSILPGDLKIGKTKNKGPKLLKEYLQYAKEISDGHPILPRPRPSEFAKSWYLKERIKSWSSDQQTYSLQEHLPFADLVLQNNDQYLGLILTDDDQYRQSISVKDSHVYVPMVLQKKGWRYLKIFSREYWMSPVEVEEQIGKFAIKES
jgi:superfamily I DNA and/or RNA helicase